MIKLSKRFTGPRLVAVDGVWGEFRVAKLFFNRGEQYESFTSMTEAEAREMLNVLDAYFNRTYDPDSSVWVDGERIWVSEKAEPKAAPREVRECSCGCGNLDYYHV